MKKLAPAPETPNKKHLRRERANVQDKQHEQDSLSETMANTAADSDPLIFPSSPPPTDALYDEHSHNDEHEHQENCQRDDTLHPYHIPNTGHRRKRRHTNHPATSSPVPEQSDSGGILKAEFKDGHAPAPGARAAASQYATPVKRRILHAIRDFELRIYTCNPFPDPEDQVAEAEDCWKRVNEELEQDMALPDRILKLVCDPKAIFMMKLLTTSCTDQLSRPSSSRVYYWCLAPTYRESLWLLAELIAQGHASQ